MLTTGIRTPIGVKVFGKDLEEIERIGSEMEIVLLSIPFALVGSVWLLYLLDYRLSTAVWVGIIALVGLAAQTGIVMIVYIDQAYERRKKAGLIRDLDDIIHAHTEGTVLRVRPKLMTVATMLIGLVPLLWATGSGAEVMKRVAAPMVGGLLEIIPVIYTYWRREQLWQRMTERSDPAFQRLQFSAWAVAAGAILIAASGAVLVLGAAEWRTIAGLVLGNVGLLLFAASLTVYFVGRRGVVRAFTQARVRW